MQVHGTALFCGPVKRGKLHKEVGGPLKKGGELRQQEGRTKRGKCTEQPRIAPDCREPVGEAVPGIHRHVSKGPDLESLRGSS